MGSTPVPVRNRHMGIFAHQYLEKFLKIFVSALVVEDRRVELEMEGNTNSSFKQNFA